MHAFVVFATVWYIGRAVNTFEPRPKELSDSAKVMFLLTNLGLAAWGIYLLWGLN